MSPVRSLVIGMGGAVPSRRIDNDEIADRYGLEPEWVTQRTGILARHVADDDTSTSDLAALAGSRAMRSAGVDTLDAVIVATTTPDYRLPGTAPKVAHQLGLDATLAYDLNAVCSGFLYALVQADACIRAGVVNSALVIGADKFSTILDPDDAVNRAIFGDGAGAFVLTRDECSAVGPRSPGIIGANALSSDGSSEAMIRVASGGSAAPPPASPTWFEMAGRAVFGAAVERMVESCNSTLERQGWGPGDVDWLIPHQANHRILRSVASNLGIEPRRAILHLDEVGNTSAASIPLAATRHAKRLKGGDRVLLTAFGGGLTWGAVAMTWPTGLLVSSITMSQTNV